MPLNAHQNAPQEGRQCEGDERCGDKSESDPEEEGAALPQPELTRELERRSARGDYQGMG